MSNEILKQAYQLIRDGNKADAIKLLTPLLKADRDNKNGWWLLANATSKPEQVEYALKNVLRIDPHHAQAQAKLDQLQADTAADFFSTVTDSPPSSIESSTLSYFGGSTAADATPQDSDWGSVNSSALATFQPQGSTYRPSGTTKISLDPTPKSASSKGMNDLVFWGILCAMVVIGGGIMVFIVSQSGLSDALSTINNDNNQQNAPPAPTPLPGWSTHRGDQMEIQLPQNWVGLYYDRNFSQNLADAKRNNPAIADQLDGFRDQEFGSTFLGVDSNVAQTGVASMVFVATESVPRNVNFDDYVNVTIDEMSETYSFTRGEDVNLDGYDAAVAEMNTTIYGIPVRQVVYVIVDGESAWLITYISDARTFFQFEAVFEVSAKSFRIR